MFESNMIIGPNGETIYRNGNMYHSSNSYDTTYLNNGFGGNNNQMLHNTYGGTSYRNGDMFFIRGKTFYKNGDMVTGCGKTYYKNGSMLQCGIKTWYNVNSDDDLFVILEKDN